MCASAFFLTQTQRLNEEARTSRFMYFRFEPPTMTEPATKCWNAKTLRGSWCAVIWRVWAQSIKLWRVVRRVKACATAWKWEWTVSAGKRRDARDLWATGGLGVVRAHTAFGATILIQQVIAEVRRQIYVIMDKTLWTYVIILIFTWVIWIIENLFHEIICLMSWTIFDKAYFTVCENTLQPLQTSST